MKNLIQSIFILIAVVMSTTVAQEVIYAPVNGTVRLPKPKDIKDGHYVYFREKNGRVLAWYNPLRGYVIQEDLPDEWKGKLSFDADSLVISNIQQEDFGTVVREVTGRRKVIDTITYKVLKINVTSNPRSPLLSGESLTLTCDAEATQGQKPQIHWLNPKNTRAGHGGTVTESAKNQHNGQWTCVATINEKESKAKITVTVIDLSPAPSSSQYTSESSSVTIPCSRPPNISWQEFITKGLKRVQWRFFPKPSSSPEGPETLMDLGVEELMTWKGPPHRKLAPNFKDGDLSLINTQTTEEHGGDYECCLTFENGRNLTRTIRVEVLKIKSSGTFISGQQVNLNCSTGYALPPDVRLQWIPPPSSSQQKSNHSSYIIPKVSTGDSGKWKCELWRSTTRLTSTTIILKIDSNLSGWMLVTICGAAVIVILTCILVLILHRRRQRKMRHLRHRVCRCKNPKPKGFQRS